jgi:hypothetical protein
MLGLNLLNLSPEMLKDVPCFNCCRRTSLGGLAATST